MKVADQELFEAGVVIGTHALRGELKVRPLTPDSSAILAATLVFLRSPSGEIARYRPVRGVQHKGNALLRLEGVDRVETAEALVGSTLQMKYDDLEALADDEYYWFELEGVRVVDQARGDLGILEDVFSTGAHDVYVVRGRFGEVLIPAVEEFIRKIDREGKRMDVDLPEGLVPQTDDL